MFQQNLIKKKFDQISENQAKTDDTGVNTSIDDNKTNLIQTENTRKKELEDELQDKKGIEFEEDFFSMTVFCYLKKNQEHFLLKSSK